jgi:uncharacterized Ntn-hydrolase superfamily protein
MTFSIVARDTKTGELGVAVQSHHFSVGTMVPWARAGVGAVATQAMAERSYGPLGLDLMSSRMNADRALEGLLSADPSREWRQVAMVDSKGNVAAFTGKKCTPYAGNISGEQYSCQGNLLARKKVVEDMSKVWSASKDLPLAERLVKALLAGEAAGGDIRGKQSAAVIVVSSERDSDPNAGYLVDLRVEDHPNPILELERLLRLKRAVDWSHRGMSSATGGDYKKAADYYGKANKIYPLNEFRFWRAVYLANSNKQLEANRIFRSVFEEDEKWILVAKRLHQVGRLAKLPRRI